MAIVQFSDRIGLKALNNRGKNCMRTMFTRSELVQHLKARAELAELEAETLQSKGANINAQKSFAHRDAYLNLVAVIDNDDSYLLEQETDRINGQISELKL